MMEVASIAIYGFPTKPSTWTEIIIAHQRKGKAMDDLISRQAAIDALRTCYDTETITMDNGDEYINYEDAVGEIEQLPPAQPEPCEDAVSREEVLNCLEWQYPDKTPRTKIMELPPVTPKQRWIPCSDRLPEKQTKVLVVDFGEVDTAYLNSEGRWMDFHGDKLKDVKAWMPLPKWEGDAE